MAPDLVHGTVANHPAIRECLEAHGFERTGASTFSNGGASVQFEGRFLLAVPKDGSRAWRSKIESTPPEVIAAMLDSLLSTTPFLSKAELDRHSERTHAAKIALNRIVEAIREAPETHSGQELRRFLWSLFNWHHDLNPWRLKDQLDNQRKAWVTEVFITWIQGYVSEETIRRALTDSGETEPQDGTRKAPEQQQY